MAQFDVHLNQGASRARFPYLLCVQSGMLRRLKRRVVIPLAPPPDGGEVPDPMLNPVLSVEGGRFLLSTQDITNIPVEALGPVVANLRHDAEPIIGAIDWMLNQGYG